MVITFIIFLLLFTLIGVASAYSSLGTKEDYYLASSSIKPWLVGLSAVATNNSGYMFIGVIGYTYATGLASIWLMIGWILGDYIASLYVHKRLKMSTDNSGEVSYPGVLSNWHGKNNTYLQRLIGIISLIFLLAYASAQLVAGSKALHVLFNWPTWVGAVMGGILVAVYCIAGGIRASIWTDAAQSFVMLFAMLLLLIVGIQTVGGIEQAFNTMSEIDGFMALFPSDLIYPGVAGMALFVVGWLFAGFSVIGQPHIMVRFMTLGADQSMRKARFWYYLWFSAFYAMATAVGMLSRIYLPDASSFDAELALPTMAMQLLHPVFVGVILAGIFAATMSTADSLVLSCSAAITHDLLPHNIENTKLIKLVTILITCCAVTWALLNKQSVFNLVIMAWSGLASAFAPLLFALCLGMRPSQSVSIISVISGLFVAIIWRYLGWHELVYEGLPGIVIGFILLLILSRKN